MTQERRPRGRCLFSEGRPRHPNPKTDRLGLMPDSRAHCWRPLADPEASGGGASGEAAAGFVRWLLGRISRISEVRSPQESPPHATGGPGAANGEHESRADAPRHSVWGLVSRASRRNQNQAGTLRVWVMSAATPGGPVALQWRPVAI